jgi:hypothetical protein
MTTPTPTTISCLTQEEQATLKTALAFVVLRNRNKNNNNNKKKRKAAASSSASTADDSFSFCRNLLSITRTTTVNQKETLLSDKSHIVSMMQMSLAAAVAASSTSTCTMNPPPKGAGAVYTHATITPRLMSLGSHLARHLTSTTTKTTTTLDQQQDCWTMQWIEETTLAQSTSTNICNICCVWHCIAASGGELILLQGIGQLLGKIYHDQVQIITNATAALDYSNDAADVVVVNLLLLLEALISMRLEVVTTTQQQQQHHDNNHQVVLKNLVDALPSALTLPIAVEDMALFCHEQSTSSTAGSSSSNNNRLSAPSKILLHLSLYDLTLKLTGVY